MGQYVAYTLARAKSSSFQSKTTRDRLSALHSPYCVAHKKILSDMHQNRGEIFHNFTKSSMKEADIKQI